MKLSFLCIATVLIVLVARGRARAFDFDLEFNPFFEFGAIDNEEDNHPESTAHKFYLGVGVNVRRGEDFKQEARTKLWALGEPTDEDREIPNDGIAASLELSYHCRFFEDFTVYPYAGMGFQRWRRNSPLGDASRFYGSLYFTEAIFGIGGTWKWFYFKAGGNRPFWSDTDSGQTPTGQLGFLVNGGVIYKAVDLGLFYNRTRFGSDGTQTAFQLDLYGFYVGYHF